MSSRSPKRKSTRQRVAASASGARRKLPRPRHDGPIEEPGSKDLRKYVYCVISTGEQLRFGRTGIGGEAPHVYTIPYRDIAAVVSDTHVELHDPTRANVLAHARVNEIALERHTVLPVSFGTVLKTHDDVLELLRTTYSTLRDHLTRMQDRVEIGLKVLWEPSEIIEALAAQDEDLGRLRKEIAARQGSTYFARIQYTRRLDALFLTHAENCAQAALEALRPVSVASRCGTPVGDNMILNASFLVDRDKQRTFDEALRQLARARPSLRLKTTGPWPPYHFVNVRLKLEDCAGVG